MKDKHDFTILALVAIVAIIALVIMFNSGERTPVSLPEGEENIGGLTRYGWAYSAYDDIKIIDYKVEFDKHNF